MLSDFHFLRPEWLLALPGVIGVALALARRRLGPGSWRAVVSAPLAPHVLSRSAGGRGDGRWWLLGLGGVIAVLSLAGPAWQRIDQPVFRSDQALVLALDLSRSMDAQDIAPSRLLRARLKILDILERRGSGQTALVVYSSNAFTVTPLTTDTDTIAALVNSLSTDIMPSRGSYPIAAINKGRQLLEQAGAGFGEILLITDGGASPAAERVARDLRDSAYSLSVLAVGTPEGAPIPRQNGGFVTGPSGEIAVPRLDANSLRRLARAGGGQFAVLTTDDSDLDLLLSGELGRSSSAADESMATDQWREEGPWLLLALLPLAALAFRRGWVALFAFVLLPASQQAEASIWDDLWRTRDQQAQRALDGGDSAAASELFEDPDWRAVAQYRNGKYADSAAAFAEYDDPRSLYNLGNALVRQGQLESALDAYEQVLEMDPDDADARYNRDLVRQLLNQQQQQQQEGQGQQQPSEEQGDGEQSDSESQADEQSESASQSEGEPQDGESSQRNDEMSEEDLQALAEELRRAAEEAGQDGEESEPQMTEAELQALRREQEQQQAMEQWLRRIPNDPGALLRNKFRYQYQKTGKDQDGNNTWPDDEVQPW